MNKKAQEFVKHSNHISLMKLYGIKENPPTSNKDPVVPVYDWTFEKHHLIRCLAETRAIHTRNWEEEFWIVDACAGSGIVYHETSRSWYEGSPLIYANTADRVARFYSSKTGTRHPSVNVFAIETRKPTFKILDKYGKIFNIETRLADFNDEIKKLIEEEIPKKEFAHFFIDPFDMGDPPIQSETVKLCLERPRSELVIFFPWEQCIGRQAGQANIPDPTEGHLKTMDRVTKFYFDDESWKEIEYNLPPQKERTNEQKAERRMRYVELYKSKLEEIFTGVKYVEIPINEITPKYFIFFVANLEAQPKIFSNEVEKTRERKTLMEKEIKEKEAPRNLTHFLNMTSSIEEVENKKAKSSFKPRRYRNLNKRGKDYCNRLLGDIKDVRGFCTINVTCNECIYNPLLDISRI